MRKKLSGEGGLTLVELLCAVVILILLGLLLNTGLQMAVNAYRAIVAQSEAELLLSTAVDAIADDLRYARDIKEDGSGGFTYTSDSFGKDAGITRDETNGQILVGGMRLLPTGAYGLNEAYRVTEMTIDLYAAGTEITFIIKMKVETADGRISAETPAEGVTVRCLNPKKDGG